MSKIIQLMTLLDPKGMVAADEKHILIVSALLMSLVVVPVIFMTLYFAWRYRASSTKATYAPNWAHSNLLEAIWWSIPCVIIVILGAITWFSCHRLDPYRPLALKTNEKTITIQAIALEWKWLFIYPDFNIATINFVQFPVGVPVKFVISAEGPMNSFHIPQLAGQIYAMGGMQTKLHMVADTVGDYNGLSANFSGDGFSDMKFIARASTQAEFNRWVKTVQKSPDALTMVSYNQLLTPSKNQTVKYYSSANKYIFDAVLMKSMMPLPATLTAKEMEELCNRKLAKVTNHA